jgi:hypothetical protein
MEAGEEVFSSKEALDLFGTPGANDTARKAEQQILKQAWSESGDEFNATLTGGGFSDEAVAGLGKFHQEVNRVADEGGTLSREGMQAMMRNQGELNNMYGGFSRAGATASSNAILRGLGGEGTAAESIMGIAAVAGLAGGANVAMGGDFTEGAAVGGGVAFAGRAIAKGVAGSMGSIENSMVKSILGDDAVVGGASREVTDNVVETVAKGTKLTDLSPVAQRELTMGQINPLAVSTKTNSPSQQTVADYVAGRGGSTGYQTKQEAEYIHEVTRTEQVTGAQARRENLTAIQGMGDDDPRLKGFGKKKMQKMLNPEKERNVAMNNRALTLAGGMLSGVAFTGQSDKRDYRRGFNSHRGNRI